MDHLSISKLLDTHRPQLANQTAALVLQNPFWIERFGEGFRERISLDIDLNLAAVAKAIRYRSPMILDDHVLWRRNQILGFGCSTGHVREIFGAKWSAASALMPAETLPTIYDYLQSSMRALAYQSAAAQQAAQAHEQIVEDLVGATFDASWHWQAAYSQDGREALQRDLWFLIDYAIDAVGQKSADNLGRHVRYRRDANLARGLSSIHMQQLIWLAAQSAEQRLAPAAASELRRTLESVVGHLSYDREGCTALVAVQEQIVADVAQELTFAGLAPQPEYAAMEVGWYLAYLNDSMASQDPTSMVGYTRWMQHYFASQGLPDTPLRQSYAAIANSLDRYLPQYAAQDARSIISAAQRVL
jgi:hypothetical protein